MPPLTWNADRTVLPDNRFQTSFSAKWRNYLTGDGSWAPIDLTPRQVSGEWVFDRGPYALTLPALADGDLTFESTNRYDIHSKRSKADAKVGIQKRYGAVSVPGEVSGDGILYAGAFPDLGADRLVQVHEQKVKDLVVWASAPPGKGAVEVPFEVDFGSLPILESTGREKAPKEYAGKGSDKDFDHGFSFTTGEFRGVQIKAPRVWDSAGKSAAIKLRGRVVGSRWVGKKVVPRSFFDTATFPVYADTTSTFYPDPNPESTSTDETVIRTGVSDSWATIRAGAGTGKEGDNTSIVVEAWKHAGGVTWQRLTRGILIFDTSALPNDATVSAATLSLYRTGHGDLGNQSVSITAGVSASNTDVVASDFQSNTSSTAFANRDITDITASQYHDWTLSAGGIATISLTSVTKFAMRMSGDVDGVEPVVAAGNLPYWWCASSETSGTSQDPKLVVTYATPDGYKNLLMTGVG